MVQWTHLRGSHLTGEEQIPIFHLPSDKSEMPLRGSFVSAKNKPSGGESQDAFGLNGPAEAPLRDMGGALPVSAVMW